jgi:hypothetical protein
MLSFDVDPHVNSEISDDAAGLGQQPKANSISMLPYFYGVQCTARPHN